MVTGETARNSCGKMLLLNGLAQGLFPGRTRPGLIEADASERAACGHIRISGADPPRPH